MAGKETGHQNTGVVEQYKGFNKLTRNIGAGVFVGALALGAAGVASVAALSVMVDQGQIKVIDKYQNWRSERNSKKLAQSATIIEFPKAGKQLNQKAA
ncbi:MAG TPA: hypothetical protein VM077_05290 [Candidatus Limnocylindrales bacterium]|nr:hypothetical protein [Candidatus Limnocylindrales bacterium]